MTRVLALHWFDVCAPWRLFTPLGALSASGYEIRWGDIRASHDLSDADLVVLHCPGNEVSVRTIEDARGRGIPVVVDVDDLFERDALRGSWPNDEETITRAASGATRVHSSSLDSILGRFHRCLQLANVVTVSTSHLLEAYVPLSRMVRVLPNCFDENSAVWNLQRPERPYLHIGFAGSEGHGKNVDLVKRPIERILSRYPHVRVVEAGGPNLLPRLDAPPEQLVYLGTQPFEGFPLLLQQMDIALAPLTDQRFNYGKSNVRCMTAGLVGVPVVASPVGAYAEYVEDGQNGIFARTDEEWSLALERLVTDAELRQQMGEANRQRARAYAIGHHLWRWREVYDGLLASRRCA